MSPYRQLVYRPQVLFASSKFFFLQILESITSWSAVRVIRSLKAERKKRSAHLVPTIFQHRTRSEQSWDLSSKGPIRCSQPRELSNDDSRWHDRCWKGGIEAIVWRLTRICRPWHAPATKECWAMIWWQWSVSLGEAKFRLLPCA